MKNNNIVISGYYGFNNAGDEAMLFAILKTLETHFTNPNITVISGDPKRTADVFHVHAVSRFDGLGIIKKLCRSSLLISGGGSLLQDVTSWKSLMYYLSIIACGIFFRNKVFLYSQGIGPVKHRWVQYILKMVLDHVSAITVRDEESKKFLKELGVRNRIYCTADSVLSLEPVSKIKGQNILERYGVPLEKKIIGISVRRWLDTDMWMDKLNVYMEKLNKNHEYAFVFIPMQYPEDYKTVCEYAQGLPDTYILKEAYDTETLMSLIGNFDMLIGIRLHALIFAALMHIPAIGISYDPKIDNFLHSWGKESIFTIENFDADKLYEESKKMLVQNPEVYDWSKVDELREKARVTMEILKEISHSKEG